MIVRSTRIQECWCPNCLSGQMEKIYEITFAEGVDEKSLIGRKVKCERCGFENIIEDVVDVIPLSFLVSSRSELSKAKSNEDLFNWLNKND